MNGNKVIKVNKMKFNQIEEYLQKQGIRKNNDLLSLHRSEQI